MEKPLTNHEVPLTNYEVYKVLQSREKHSKISLEFKDYLEKINATKPSKYPTNTFKKLIDPIELCIIANVEVIRNEEHKKFFISFE